MVRALRELILSAFLVLALFLTIDNVTARSYVQGPSMEPTLQQDQVLLISRLGISGFTGKVYAAAHHEEEDVLATYLPERGSICTFVHPSDPSKVLVKRLVGLPGEEVAIKDGLVYINGQKLDEPYVVSNDHFNMTPERIPSDAVFMLGDNRPRSSDSRYFGPVPRSNLLGVAMARYWPISDFSLFVGYR